jgi:hypothetical protein
MAPSHLVPFDRHSPHLDAISALCERVWGGAGATAQVARHATYPGFKGIVALTPGGGATAKRSVVVAGVASRSSILNRRANAIRFCCGI